MATTNDMEEKDIGKDIEATSEYTPSASPSSETNLPISNETAPDVNDTVPDIEVILGTSTGNEVAPEEPAVSALPAPETSNEETAVVSVVPVGGTVSKSEKKHFFGGRKNSSRDERQASPQDGTNGERTHPGSGNAPGNPSRNSSGNSFGNPSGNGNPGNNSNGNPNQNAYRGTGPRPDANEPKDYEEILHEKERLLEISRLYRLRLLGICIGAFAALVFYFLFMVFFIYVRKAPIDGSPILTGLVGVPLAYFVFAFIAAMFFADESRLEAFAVSLISAPATMTRFPGSWEIGNNAFLTVIKAILIVSTFTIGFVLFVFGVVLETLISPFIFPILFARRRARMRTLRAENK